MFATDSPTRTHLPALTRGAVATAPRTAQGQGTAVRRTGPLAAEGEQFPVDRVARFIDGAAWWPIVVSPSCCATARTESGVIRPLYAGVFDLSPIGYGANTQ